MPEPFQGLGDLQTKVLTDYNIRISKTIEYTTETFSQSVFLGPVSLTPAMYSRDTSSLCS